MMMSDIDKDYMPYEEAIKEVIAFLTQNLNSSQAWQFTDRRGKELAHVIIKRAKDNEQTIQQLTDELSDVKFINQRLGYNWVHELAESMRNLEKPIKTMAELHEEAKQGDSDEY